MATWCGGGWHYCINVSIHATLAGGDLRLLCHPIDIIRFYPRHPRGWRHRRAYIDGIEVMFLSTPPSRVATGRIQGLFQQAVRFYPRHPRGWRPFSLENHAVIERVSIHATLAGGDMIIKAVQIENGVSIHATLAGGDNFFTETIPNAFRFYPRHPRGWRQQDFNRFGQMANRFYPRHPRGWRHLPAA